MPQISLTQQRTPYWNPRQNKELDQCYQQDKFPEPYWQFRY